MVCSTVPGLRRQTTTGSNHLRTTSILPQLNVMNAFSWMKMFQFLLNFHWSLLPVVQLTLFQHWIQIMDWRRTGDMPSSEPVMAQVADAYMRHFASMNQWLIIRDKMAQMQMKQLYEYNYYDIIWYNMIRYDMMWCDMISYRIVLYCIILYHIILYYIISYYIICMDNEDVKSTQ